MILETIVTSVAEDGTVNCAPMGVEWGEHTIALKPFLETATYRNVVATDAAVVNLIDDVRVFARAAIQIPNTRRCQQRSCVASCCSRTAARGAKSRFARSTARRPVRGLSPRWCTTGTRREFIGFNRARHAVLEAAIYATRLHILPRAFVENELARLQVIVNKTADAPEVEAMALLTGHVRSVPLAPDEA